MTLLIIYALLAIGISFLCSLLEACLLSLPRSFVESMVHTGAASGRMLKKMKENIDRSLAAILTLNTIAHTVGAAGVGAQAAAVFGSHTVGIASAIMTLLILVLSEIIPKTLGAVHAKTLAVPATMIIHVMIIICIPVVLVLEWINRLVGYTRHEENMNRAELLASIHLGHSAGVLHNREYRVASNLLALSSISLADILTPRTVVFSLPADITVAQAVREHYPMRFARIPVYQDNPEHVTGYVARYDIHAAESTNQGNLRLQDIANTIPILPEVSSVANALDTLVHNRQHIALVVDEHGGMAGIVTLEDLMETLLGEEIVDESDIAEDMQRLARARRERRHPRQ